MSQRVVKVVGAIFVKKGAVGDFDYMRRQPQYKGNTLFLMCENFLDSVGDEQTPGGGTAVLRPFAWPHCQGQPIAAGIPTGWSSNAQGFMNMDRTYIKRAIDLSFMRIVCLLDTYANIDTIVFSSDQANTKLIGTGIFHKTLGADVIQYISDNIHALPKRQKSHLSLDQIREKEYELLPIALSVDFNAQLIRKYEAARGEIQKLREELKTIKSGAKPTTPKRNLATRDAVSGGGGVQTSLRMFGANGPADRKHARY